MNEIYLFITEMSKAMIWVVSILGSICIIGAAWKKYSQKTSNQNKEDSP